jgi:hypothetical protein
MRSFFLLGLMVLVGCGDDNAQNGADLSTSADLSAGVDDLAGGGGGDLAGGGDDSGLIVITDGGSNGATCTTACDCLPGLACVGGLCRQGTAPVYCCNSTSCPIGDICQSSTGGYGRCGMAKPDLGAFDHCTLINCMASAGGTNECTRAGCTSCSAAGACAQ